MAIVVESTATNTDTSSTSLTITKPTGLSVGDLMVAPLSIHNVNGPATETWNTLSGWTSAIGGNFESKVSHSIQYKIADSGDVAASNFTFTASGTAGYLVGSIIRCSGNAPSTPLGTTDSETNATSGTVLSGALTAYTPPEDGALAIIQVGAWTTATSIPTVSGYGTTASGISFTELYDNGAASSDSATTSAAYGIQATAAELTSYTASINITTNARYGQFAVFLPVVNGNGSNALLEVSPTIFAPTMSNTNTVSNALLEVSPTINEANGVGTSPTQWQSPNKESTDWTNKQI